MNVFGQVVNAERPIANRLVAFRESEQQVELLARYGQATKPIATKRLNMVPILLDEKSPNGMEMWLVSYSFFYFLSNSIKLSTNTETAMPSRCDFHTESLNAWLELGIVTHHWVILTGLETRWEVMEVVSVWRRILGSGLVYPNRRRVSSWHWMSATSAFKVEAF